MSPMPKNTVVQPLRIADARSGLRHVFLRDLERPCRIGVHAHERERPQRVRINLDLAVWEDQPDQIGDNLANVVCYEMVAERIRAILDDGHVNLVETLAERIAHLCLQDPRVHSARVRIEKLEVFPDAFSAGVEIERFNPVR
ncbi:dihydroneopterin aldolase [Roseospirillum parvum]|uniref:dihydroneopterin aldolase n=1 Tax=Roseospirillum parvum TaxID=83401 RepID=A0A1G7V7X9_9PROT|nr:dihydroneopterin aldolase [Roseospirillum parvum]SDG55698.1 dihydroneopterin aldolase [Roseospirillum parvum]